MATTPYLPFVDFYHDHSHVQIGRFVVGGARSGAKRAPSALASLREPENVAGQCSSVNRCCRWDFAILGFCVFLSAMEGLLSILFTRFQAQRSIPELEVSLEAALLGMSRGRPSGCFAFVSFMGFSGSFSSTHEVSFDFLQKADLRTAHRNRTSTDFFNVLKPYTNWGGGVHQPWSRTGANGRELAPGSMFAQLLLQQAYSGCATVLRLCQCAQAASKAQPVTSKSRPPSNAP